MSPNCVVDPRLLFRARGAGREDVVDLRQVLRIRTGRVYPGVLSQPAGRRLLGSLLTMVK